MGMELQKIPIPIIMGESESSKLIYSSYIHDHPIPIAMLSLNFCFSSSFPLSPLEPPPKKNKKKNDAEKLLSFPHEWGFPKKTHLTGLFLEFSEGFPRFPMGLGLFLGFSSSFPMALGPI